MSDLRRDQAILREMAEEQVWDADRSCLASGPEGEIRRDALLRGAYAIEALRQLGVPVRTHDNSTNATPEQIEAALARALRMAADFQDECRPRSEEEALHRGARAFERRESGPDVLPEMRKK